MLEINLVNEKPDIKKILLIGQEGSGKTHFIGTMPKPICIFSFDKGISTLSGEEGIQAYVFMDEDRYKPVAWTEFKAQLGKLISGQLKYKHKDGREEPFKTVAFDSYTALSKFILDHSNYINQTIDAKVVGFTPYTQTKSYLQDVTVKSILAAEYIVCTAIVEAEKDETTGALYYRPSTEGSFRQEVGQWFDAVGYMTVDIDLATKKPVYKMDLLGDRAHKAKIRLPMSMDNTNNLVITNPSFAKLQELLKPKTVK